MTFLTSDNIVASGTFSVSTGSGSSAEALGFTVLPGAITIIMITSYTAGLDRTITVGGQSLNFLAAWPNINPATGNTTPPLTLFFIAQSSFTNVFSWATASGIVMSGRYVILGPKTFP